MVISNIEGLKSYYIGYNDNRSDGNYHYNQAEFIYKGYLISLKREYYETLDESVKGLKERLIKAVKDFDLKYEE